jgi:hypothetical protein
VASRNVSAEATAGPPLTDDETKWESEALTARHASLTNVRSTAEKWTATIATLLSLFSAVVIVRGGADISKVSSGLRNWVLVLLGAAGVSAFLAVFQGALAAQGTPHQLRYLDGQHLQEFVIREAPKAARRLQRSRSFGVAAAALIFAAGGVVAVDAAITVAPSSGAGIVVIHNNGTVECIELGDTSMPLSHVTEVRQAISVSSCSGP